MARTQLASSIKPGSLDQEQSERALRRIKEYLMRHPEEKAIKVAAERAGDEALVLPREAVSMLAYILAQIAEGRGVQVMPSHAELTTQQAAATLNVSRPYLIGLLEAGAIPFRLVGRHRRIRHDDLMEYVRQDSVKRRAAADELSDLGQELGL
ncbi:excisionase [Acrocarpospora phusangensis]|uniref:Excisionase n=1 Tax=Acrocarpospora phusangensis TaxID=1070424 RepID=A0A919Q5H0_9ACTN|nr:excisionase family DNA-binding protein [Acrocarpospora phusangensis]GIH22313.1 excisionase [Acrocarpospora phusangensis]